MTARRVTGTVDEPLAVLLLPCRLEDFELADHARDLLAIPRVVALEPPRRRLRGPLLDGLLMRQARRLRFPGAPRVLVLYGPTQYPLARALSSHYDRAELWYVHIDMTACWQEDGRRGAELDELDALAAARATRTVVASQGADPRVQNESIRRRLVELEVISSRAFLPGARLQRN
jgi:hypothetical protein